jgi:hypothetical protein
MQHIAEIRSFAESPLPDHPLRGGALNMTAVISIATRSALWVVADRRLTIPKTGQIVVDNAVKVIRIYTNDGEMLLSYKGLGRVLDRQISLWVYRTLRGITNLSLVESLDYIARRAKMRFKPFLKYLHGDPHIFMAAASVGRKFSNIEADITKEPPQLIFHMTRRSTEPNLKIIGVRRDYISDEIQDQMLALYPYIQKYERGKIGARFFASKLAKIMVKVSEHHRNNNDNRISPESLVVMHRLKTSKKYKNIAAENVPPYWCFDANGNYVPENIIVPCIVNGIPASDLALNGLRAFQKRGIEGRINLLEFIAPVPNTPDDDLPDR